MEPRKINDRERQQLAQAQAALGQLTAEQIRARLEELAQEQASLRVLLRHAVAREFGRRRTDASSKANADDTPPVEPA